MQIELHVQWRRVFSMKLIRFAINVLLARLTGHSLPFLLFIYEATWAYTVSQSTRWSVPHKKGSRPCRDV